MDKLSHTIAFIAAATLHVLLAIFLLVSLEKTIFVPAELPDPNKPIIDATVMNQHVLQQEIDRLNAIEAKKRQAAIARSQERLRKEQEAEQKRIQEEARAEELRLQNEQLKIKAQEQRLAQIKEAAAVEAKLKAEKELLKQLEKDKVLALAQKKKEEEKLAQLAQKKKEEEKIAQQKKEEEQRIAALKEEKERLKKEAALEALKKEQAAQEAIKNARALKIKEDQIMRFAMMMRNKIHQHWRQPLGFNLAGFKCKIKVKLLPTGEVMDASVVESSGNVEFDRSTELAIRKASPLPIPEDPALAREFREFTFTFNPESV